MIVALIGKEKIYKITLPGIIAGDYWISDEQDKKILNLKITNGKCLVTSSATTKIINPKKIEKSNDYFSRKADNAVIAECYIEPYSINYVAIKGYDELFILYGMPTCEKFEKYEINNSLEITIGSGAECHIQVNNPIVKSKHARIYYSNTQLMLENFDDNYGTFLNNRSCRKIFKAII